MLALEPNWFSNYIEVLNLVDPAAHNKVLKDHYQHALFTLAKLPFGSCISRVFSQIPVMPHEYSASCTTVEEGPTVTDSLPAV